MAEDTGVIGYYILNVCGSPQIHMLKPSPPHMMVLGGGGLWKVIRIKQGHEGGAQMRGISALRSVMRETPSSALRSVI